MIECIQNVIGDRAKKKTEQFDGNYGNIVCFEQKNFELTHTHTRTRRKKTKQSKQPKIVSNK